MAKKEQMRIKDVSEERMDRYRKDTSSLVEKLNDVYLDGINDIVEKNKEISTFEIFLILAGSVEIGADIFIQNASLSKKEYADLLKQVARYLNFEAEKAEKGG